jgi:hypothetical protein
MKKLPGSRNIMFEQKAGKLLLEIDLTKGGKPSKSGKTSVIGTTKGNKEIPGMPGKLGLNYYVPADQDDDED